MAERSLPQLFEDSVRAYPTNVLMWEKKDGRYRGTTYLEARTLVHSFAAGLRDLGLRPGDRPFDGLRLAHREDRLAIAWIDVHTICPDPVQRRVA